MLVLDAGPNADHAPPFEVDGGRVMPPTEVPARMDAIRHGLARVPATRFEKPSPHGRATAWLHDLDYRAFLRETCDELRRSPADRPLDPLFPSVFPYRAGQTGMSLKGRLGQYCFDTHTPLLPGTFDAALRTVTTAVHAADVVASGIERLVYALGRPPGHHAEKARYGGYSYLNATAHAADRLSNSGPVAVLDIDVHHGNGTQHLFYDRRDVFTVSVHGDPAFLFPHFSGFADETGTGPGLGANLNLPLWLKTDDRTYQPALETALERIARSRPAFLVVAVGYDAHERDPIGGFALTTPYYETVGRTVRQLGLPTVVVQEGGYGLADLSDLAAAFGRGLVG
ncbi:MAG TPA: histone deacetylase family protein [Gemmataceae bacterium]|jgi:acetoin utilization deacetylase AcuC-like enzyme|nr:histone deacetylase family protein [Gemmataceae bacterium]